MILLAILGAALLLAGSLASYRAMTEAQYVEAIGRTISAEIKKDTTRFSGSTASAQHWKLYVEYEYWIGGEHYVSDEVAANRPSSKASSGQRPSPELEALLAAYEPGTEIKVFVSPSQPKKAVLIKASFWGIWLIVGGVIVAGVATALWFRAV